MLPEMFTHRKFQYKDYNSKGPWQKETNNVLASQELADVDDVRGPLKKPEGLLCSH